MDLISSNLIDQGVYFVVLHVGKALAAPLIMQSELYWVYLFSGFAIAWLVWKLYLVRQATYASATASGSFWQNFFSRDIWWHPSARVDYKFYVLNALLMAWISSQFWVSEQTVISWLSALGPSQAQEPLAAPHILSRLVFTLLFFVAYDLGRFVAHSLLHDIAWLWGFHQVHHSAQVLTPLTAYRVHPVDLAVMAWVPAVFTGVLSWAYAQWVDPSVTFFTFMGFHALVWLFNLIDHLRHWHVWVTYGTTLNRWFISPAHHQLHHSANPEHWGCNRGYELAIWDRLYGTFIQPSLMPMVFAKGLGDGTDGQWHTLRALFLRPFTQLLAHLFARLKPKRLRL